MPLFLEKHIAVLVLSFYFSTTSKTVPSWFSLQIGGRFEGQVRLRSVLDSELTCSGINCLANFVLQPVVLFKHPCADIVLWADSGHLF